MCNPFYAKDSIVIKRCNERSNMHGCILSGVTRPFPNCSFKGTHPFIFPRYVCINHAANFMISASTNSVLMPHNWIHVLRQNRTKIKLTQFRQHHTQKELMLMLNPYIAHWLKATHNEHFMQSLNLVAIIIKPPQWFDRPFLSNKTRYWTGCIRYRSFRCTETNRCFVLNWEFTPILTWDPAI